MRAATAHDLVTVRESGENYGAQVLRMGQNITALTAANTLVKRRGLRPVRRCSHGVSMGPIAGR